jgi:hypothetical protein
MKKITGILFLTLFASNLLAQRNCGTEEYKRLLLQTNPSFEHSFNVAEQQIQKTLKEQKRFLRRDTFANELINIPVVVHVVYNNADQNISDAQIQSQLTALNNDFSNQNADKASRPGVFNNLAADARIHFCLAQVTPDGKATNGIIRRQTNTALFTADDAMKSNVRGGDNSWDSKKYLNIWICNLGARTLGYATLPGSAADVDGVVIGFDVFGTVGNVRSPFNKGRTATHEVGHWLGLKHLWGDVECGDDSVDDTPRQKSYNFGCPSFPHVTDCSPDADGDMFMNYMDFSDDACMNMFTMEQMKRMRALFASGNIRNSFLASLACDSTLVQGGPVVIDTVPVVPAVKKDTFKIYPNPVQSVATVEYKPANDMLVKSFSIYNMTGIKVFMGELTKEKTSINLSSFIPGVYIIRIGEGSGKFTTKILKK